MRNLIILFVIIFNSLLVKAQLFTRSNLRGSDSWYQCLHTKNNRLWAVATKHYYYRDAADSTWHTPIPEAYITYNMANHGDTILLSYSDLPDGVIKTKISIDNGTSFNTMLNTNGIVNSGDFFFLGNKIACRKNFGPVRDTICYTTDFGNTWQTKDVVKGFYPSKFHQDQYPILGFNEGINSSYKVLVSYDELNTIDTIFDTKDSFDFSYQRSVFFHDSTYYIYLPFYIVKTTNAGINIDTVFTDLSNSNIKYGCAKSFGDTICTGYGYFSNGSGVNLFKNYQGGLGTWQKDSSAKLDIIINSYFSTYQQINSNQILNQQFNNGLQRRTGLYNIVADSSIDYSNGLTCPRDIIGIYSEGNKLYSLTTEYLEKSIDNGHSWIDISPPHFIQSYGFKPIFRGDTIIVNYYLQSNYLNIGAYVSFNDGSTWQDYLQINRMVYDYKDNVLYSDTSYSNDLGNTWLPLNNAPTQFYYSRINFYNDTCKLLGYNLPNSNFVGIAIMNNSTKSYLFVDTCTINAIPIDSNYNINAVMTDFGWFGYVYNSQTGGTNTIINPNLYPMNNVFSVDGANWQSINVINPSSEFSSASLSMPVKYKGFYIANGGNDFYGSLDCKTFSKFSSFKDIYYFNAGSVRNFLTQNDTLICAMQEMGIMELHNSFDNYGGNVFLDTNNNGIKDAGEQGVANCLVHNQSDSIVVATSQDGDYGFFKTSGLDTIMPVGYPGFVFNPNKIVINTAGTNNNFAMQVPLPFCNYQLNGSTNYLKPGNNCNVYINLKNLGTLQGADTIQLVVDTLLQNIVFTPAPTFVQGAIYKWAIPNIALFDAWSIIGQASVSTSAIVGDTVKCILNLITTQVDIDSTNNGDTIIGPIYSSYDPNSKECKQGSNYLINSDAPLVYTIHFQNEGTANTDFVKVEDVLSNKLNASTFNLLQSSHPCTTEIANNKIKFIFNPIHLTPKSVDENNSQGFVTFSVMPKLPINLGDTISNFASIYFDYNYPIITDTTKTKIVSNFPLSSSISKAQNKISLIPNPAQDKLYLIIDPQLVGAQCIISDNLGRKIMTLNLKENKTKIDINGLVPGVYNLNVANRKQKSSLTFIKQ